MAKIKILIHTNLNNEENNEEITALIVNSVIKYIDSLNNKFLVDLNNLVLEKENTSSKIKIDFNNKKAFIYVKELRKEFVRDIDIIDTYKNQTDFFVKYKLVEENIINEYNVKIL